MSIKNTNPEIVVMPRALYDKLMEEMKLWDMHSDWPDQIYRYNEQLIAERVAARREASKKRLESMQKLEKALAQPVVWIKPAEVHRLWVHYWYRTNQVPDHVLAFLDRHREAGNPAIPVKPIEQRGRFELLIAIDDETQHFKDFLVTPVDSIYLTNPDTVDRDELLDIVNVDPNYSFIYLGPSGAVSCKVTMQHDNPKMIYIQTEDGSEFPVPTADVKPR